MADVDGGIERRTPALVVSNLVMEEHPDHADS